MSQTKDKNSGFSLIVVIVIIAIIAFIGGGIYYYLNSNNQPAPSSKANGLEWSSTLPDELLWDEADIACAEMKPAGMWRLPSKEELESGLIAQFITDPPTMDGFEENATYMSSGDWMVDGHYKVLKIDGCDNFAAGSICSKCCDDWVSDRGIVTSYDYGHRNNEVGLLARCVR